MNFQMEQSTASVAYIADDFDINELENAAWQQARAVAVTTYWSGETAPEGRHFEARLLWSDTHLYAKFTARQTEDLVVNPTPNTTMKTNELWERDVCEIFIAPDRMRPNRYLEFEVAPTGEWIDLAIEIAGDVRNTDWEFASQMKIAADIADTSVTMAIKVPFAAFDASPARGDVWLGNIFRCVGSGTTRGYLAWRPTRTETPAFHVPSAFAEIRFE